METWRRGDKSPPPSRQFAAPLGCAAYSPSPRLHVSTSSSAVSCFLPSAFCPSAAAWTSGAQTSLAGAGVNVRGNTAGGVPGAREAAATGGPDVFPFEIDEAALRRGRERFQIYCIVCHGATGEGDGMVVRRGFRKPPSYYEDRLQENVTPAAHFFDVITNGWGAMPSYAEQIPPEDRWKIIAYIRALQLSRRVKFDDLSPEERQRVQSGAPKASTEEQGGTLLQTHQGGENQ